MYTVTSRIKNKPSYLSYQAIDQYIYSVWYDYLCKFPNTKRHLTKIKIHDRYVLPDKIRLRYTLNKKSTIIYLKGYDCTDSNKVVDLKMNINCTANQFKSLQVLHKINKKDVFFNYIQFKELERY